MTLPETSQIGPRQRLAVSVALLVGILVVAGFMAIHGDGTSTAIPGRYVTTW